MLEGLLHDLRMQYVSLVNAPPKARRSQAPTSPEEDDLGQ